MKLSKFIFYHTTAKEKAEKITQQKKDEPKAEPQDKDKEEIKNDSLPN